MQFSEDLLQLISKMLNIPMQELKYEKDEEIGGYYFKSTKLGKTGANMLVDENGNYTSNWESSDSIYYISVEPGKYDLKYSNLDSKGEYYCLFKIYDVKKQVHYSNLVKIN